MKRYFEILPMSPNSLKKARTILNLTREELGKEIGASPGQIYKMEQGEFSYVYPKIIKVAKNKLNALLIKNNINIRIV